MDCGGTSKNWVAGQIMEIEREILDQLYVTTMRVERESNSKLVENIISLNRGLLLNYYSLARVYITHPFTPLPLSYSSPPL